MPAFEEVRTVTIDGRVVIPWIVQRALGLDHGGPIRFRVEDGVVTLLSVEGRKVGAASAEVRVEPSRTDVRAALRDELNALLAASERDRAKQNTDAGA